MKFRIANKDEILRALSEVEEKTQSLRFALTHLPEEIIIEAVDENITDDKNAHWFDVGSLSCRCSVCGCKNDKETTFCPHCGTKLKGR